MRIHTDTLTNADVLTAALQVGVIVHGLDTHASRSRQGAITFYLEGDGVMRGQWGNSQYKSATWDQWGGVIGLLYTRDPLAHYGKNNYESADHFHWMTGNRFVNGLPSDHHYRHVWDWQNQTEAATGSYVVTPCKKCTAITRRLLVPGITWTDFMARTA